MTRMKRSALTRVINLETKVKGTVLDVLSSQITVEYDDGSFGFLMFKYKGVDWKPIYNKENNNDPHNGKQQ